MYNKHVKSTQYSKLHSLFLSLLRVACTVYNIIQTPYPLGLAIRASYLRTTQNIDSQLTKQNHEPHRGSCFDSIIISNQYLQFIVAFKITWNVQ